MRGIVAAFFFCISAAHAGALGGFSERQLLIFHPSLAAPKVGENYVLLVQADSGFVKNELVLDFYLDSIRREAIQTGSLWSLDLGSFGEVRSHLLVAKVFGRDEKESKRIQVAIGQLEKDIQQLNREIDQEQDEAKRQVLISRRDEKLAYKEKLEEELERLKVFMKEESFAFQIAEDPFNPIFPFINAITPSLGLLQGGTRIAIQGTNFPDSPVVKIGGIHASLLSSTSTEIQALTPAFPSLGIKDVSIEFPSVTKNAVKRNAFFVTEQSILINLRPVANAIGYVHVDWPVAGPVVLNGSASYDSNVSDTHDFLWKVLNVPQNGNLTPGSYLVNSPTPSFTPNKKGTWLFELKTREQNTPERLESLPIQITVEVGK